jgi:hypothetical protein
MDAGRIDELKRAERRLQAAQLASDVIALGELLDEDAIFTGPDGNLYTRDDDLRVHGTGQQVMTRVDEHDLRVSTFGDDIGVTFFLGTLEGTVGDAPIKARMRYTRTWRHDDTGRRINAAHASFLVDDPQSG